MHCRHYGLQYGQVSDGPPAVLFAQSGTRRLAVGHRRESLEMGRWRAPYCVGMGFSYRKRLRTGRNSWINLSKSGPSVTFRKGPFSVNSRGRVTTRLAPGLSYRGGCAMVMVLPLAALATAALAASRW